MPAYNCQVYIQEAIESVLNQTYTHWELLVADDGSSDTTCQIIDAFEDTRIKKSHNAVNQGNIRTRNRLFGEAKGEFLTVLDADDLMVKDRLEKQLIAFQKYPNLGACVSNCFHIDIEGRISLGQQVREDFYLDVDNFNYSYTFPPASIILKREVYEKIGGLHLYFDRLFAEDRYWIYLIVEQYKVLYLKDPLYFYRANPFSLTNYLDNPRKLTVTTLVDELIKQRKEEGSDWLSDGLFEKASAFEKSLIKKRKWIGERYRICAARHIDLLQFLQARRLLLKAMSLNPYNIDNIRTMFYFLKMRVTLLYKFTLQK